MGDVTCILEAVEQGNSQAAEELLPLIYDELRRLAAQRLSREKPGQTLQATALVHEAYLRLISSASQRWNGRRHFFAAAAEAMRRILVDNARRKKAEKRGGDRQRVTLDEAAPVDQVASDELLVLDEMLQELAANDPLGARLVELRYFAGLDVEQAAAAIGISAASAYRHWSFARAWLHAEMGQAKRSAEK